MSCAEKEAEASTPSPDLRTQREYRLGLYTLITLLPDDGPVWRAALDSLCSAPRRAACFCVLGHQAPLSSPGMAKVALNGSSAFRCRSPKALLDPYRTAVFKKPTAGEETLGILLESSNSRLRKMQPLGRTSPCFPFYINCS